MITDGVSDAVNKMKKLLNLRDSARGGFHDNGEDFPPEYRTDKFGKVEIPPRRKGKQNNKKI